jgi:hypothetical protein
MRQREDRISDSNYPFSPQSLRRFYSAGHQIGASGRLRPIEALAHFLAGLEKRHGFLIDRHMRPGSGVATRARRPVLNRKSSEAAQFDAVSPSQRGHDFTEDRVDDIFHVTLVKVGILSRNALDEF